MKHLVPFLTVSASLFVSGCMYGQAHTDTRTTYHAPASAQVVASTPRYVTVQQAPPAVRASVTQGPKPSQTSAWIDGYWAQEGGRWVWIPGHWEEPRQRGHVWQPPVCVRADNNSGYRYYPGYWHGQNDRVDPMYHRTDGVPVYVRPTRRAGPYVQERPRQAPVQDVLVRPGSSRPRNAGSTVTVRPGTRPQGGGYTEPAQPVYTQPSRPAQPQGGTVTVRPSPRQPARPSGTVQTRPNPRRPGTVAVRPTRPAQPARPSGTVTGRPTRPSGTVSGGTVAGGTQPRPAVRVRPRAPSTDPSPAGAVTVSPNQPVGTVRPGSVVVSPTQPAGTARPRPGSVVVSPTQPAGTVRPGTVVHTPSQVPGTARPAQPAPGTLQPSGVRPGTVEPGGVVVNAGTRPVPGAVPGTARPTQPAQPVAPVCRLTTTVAPRGGLITITGRNFDRSLTVRIGGNFGATVGVSSMRVTAQVPRNSRGGAVVVEQGGHSVTCGTIRIAGR